MATPEDADPLIDEIYEIRTRISAAHGDDIDRLFDYYMELQEQFRDRLLSTRGAQASKKNRKDGDKSAA